MDSATTGEIKAGNYRKDMGMIDLEVPQRPTQATEVEAVEAVMDHHKGRDKEGMDNETDPWVTVQVDRVEVDPADRPIKEAMVPLHQVKDTDRVTAKQVNTGTNNGQVNLKEDTAANKDGGSSAESRLQCILVLRAFSSYDTTIALRNPIGRSRVPRAAIFSIVTSLHADGRRRGERSDSPCWEYHY